MESLPWRAALREPSARYQRPSVWEQPIGTFTVDFKKQGDEWMHHLAVELTGNKHISATGTDGTSPVEIGPPTMGSVTSKLSVSPHEDGLACVVVGNGDVVSDDQMAPWRRIEEQRSPRSGSATANSTGKPSSVLGSRVEPWLDHR
jgi:hypothetical protein